MTYPPTPPQPPAGGPGPQQPAMNGGGAYPPPPFPNQPQQPMYSYELPGVALVQGTGQARAMKSLGKSFGLFSNSAGAWVIFTLVVGLGVMIVSGLVGAIVGAVFGGASALSSSTADTVPQAGVIVGDLVSALTTALFVLYISNGALQAAEGRQLTFGKFFRLKHGFVTPYIMAVVLALVSSLPMTVGQLMSVKDPLNSSLLYLLASNEGDMEAVMKVFNAGPMLAGFILAIVVFLITPLITLATFYCLDQGMSIGQALSACVSDSLRNYFKILGFYIVMGIVMLIGMIPLFLGLLVVIPAAYIGLALIYRQASGGLHVDLDS